MYMLKYCHGWAIFTKGEKYSVTNKCCLFEMFVKISIIVKIRSAKNKRIHYAVV